MKKFFTLMLCLITLSITMVSCGDDEPGDGGKESGMSSTYPINILRTISGRHITSSIRTRWIIMQL